MSKSKNAMKPDEQAAMDGRIVAGRDRSNGGSGKLAKWRDKIQISRPGGKIHVRRCGSIRTASYGRRGTPAVKLDEGPKGDAPTIDHIGGRSCPRRATLLSGRVVL